MIHWQIFFNLQISGFPSLHIIYDSTYILSVYAFRFQTRWTLFWWRLHQSIAESRNKPESRAQQSQETSQSLEHSRVQRLQNLCTSATTTKQTSKPAEDARVLDSASLNNIQYCSYVHMIKYCTVHSYFHICHWLGSTVVTLI